MPTPFVSVIVATKNRKDMLRQLLDSFESQTYPRDRFQVVLVDDGSTDGAWEWVQQSAGGYGYSMRVLRNDKPMGGPAAPRNLGIRVSEGDILAFTDSDCVVSPDWIAAGASGFTSGVGLVQGKTIPHPDDPKTMFSTTNVVSTVNGDSCNIFYLRSAVEQAGGGFSTDFIGPDSQFAMYGDDVDLAYRVKEAGYRAVFVEGAVVMHHVVPLTFRQWLLRPRSAITGPFLVARHPSIREELLFLRYFVNPMTALFDLLVVSVLLGLFWHPAALLLSLPFFAGKYLESTSRNPLVRLLRVAGGSVRSLIMFCALIYGSFRARTVLL